MIYYAALFASVILNAVSLVLLKRYAHLSAPLPAESGESSGVWAMVVRLVSSPAIITSVVCYGFAAVFWMIALFRVDLTVAYPTVGLTYVFVALVAPKLFSEEMGAYRWVGISLIVGGVVIMHV